MMARISNDRVYGLAESIYRSGYPMMAEAPDEKTFYTETTHIEDAIKHGIINPHIRRAIKLASMTGGGHDQFLTGIIVQFDLTFSNKAWVEAERYTFLDFISSMSTMHRIRAMNPMAQCNGCVSRQNIETLMRSIEAYDAIDEAQNPADKKNAYLGILYNIPAGFELTAGITTNYRCLKNIYHQRRNHRLPDWQVFCDWVETLPMAKGLII